MFVVLISGNQVVGSHKQRAEAAVFSDYPQLHYNLLLEIRNKLASKLQGADQPEHLLGLNQRCLNNVTSDKVRE